MVYNFTVDALHTYTITELRVVVHNTGSSLCDDLAYLLAADAQKAKDIRDEVFALVKDTSHKPLTVIHATTDTGQKILVFSDQFGEARRLRSAIQHVAKKYRQQGYTVDYGKRLDFRQTEDHRHAEVVLANLIQNNNIRGELKGGVSQTICDNCITKPGIQPRKNVSYFQHHDAEVYLMDRHTQ